MHISLVDERSSDQSKGRFFECHNAPSNVTKADQFALKLSLSCIECFVEGDAVAMLLNKVLIMLAVAMVIAPVTVVVERGPCRAVMVERGSCRGLRSVLHLHGFRGRVLTLLGLRSLLHLHGLWGGVLVMLLVRDSLIVLASSTGVRVLAVVLLVSLLMRLLVGHLLGRLVCLLLGGLISLLLRLVTIAALVCSGLILGVTAAVRSGLIAGLMRLFLWSRFLAIHHQRARVDLFGLWLLRTLRGRGGVAWVCFRAGESFLVSWTA